MNPTLMAAIALLLGSANFSGAEAALFTLASGAPRDRTHIPRVAHRLLEDQVGALTTILLFNLVVNLSFFATVHSFASGFEAGQAALINGSAILVIVLFGEVLPKVLAHRYPQTAGTLLLLPVNLFHRLFGRILRPLGRNWGRPAHREVPLDTSQTSELLEGAEAQVLDHRERDLIQRVLELGKLRAGALRRSLRDIPRIEAHLPWARAVQQLAKQCHPWAAVVGPQGDVVGVFDRTRVTRQTGLVADAMMPVPILPEVAPVANGVQLLRASGGPFVLLVDEYGDSVGIIERGRWADTLLDRLPGAAEGGPPLLRQLPRGRWQVDASLPLHDFMDRFGHPGEFDVRIDTLGGLVAERLGRMTEVGDRIRLEGANAQFELEVLSCSETRPLQLELRILHDTPEQTEEST